jgi:hypothetical protein
VHCMIPPRILKNGEVACCLSIEGLLLFAIREP